jgi:hypothetical protein
VSEDCDFAETVGLKGSEVKISAKTASVLTTKCWRCLCDADRHVRLNWNNKGWYFFRSAELSVCKVTEERDTGDLDDRALNEALVERGLATLSMICLGMILSSIKLLRLETPSYASFHVGCIEQQVALGKAKRIEP